MWKRGRQKRKVKEGGKRGTQKRDAKGGGKRGKQKREAKEWLYLQWLCKRPLIPVALNVIFIRCTGHHGGTYEAKMLRNSGG